MMTPREGDSSNIPSYNQNPLVAMAPHPQGFDFCVFDFIWKEIKAISDNPLKGCGYIPYIMHIIERVMGQTFGCDKEHHPLRIKNNLEAPMEDRRAVTPRSSPPRAARGRGQQEDKPLYPIQKIFNFLFGMCKSQHVVDVKAQHERRARRKDNKSVMGIHAHLNLHPPHSLIACEGEESPEIESFEERFACFDIETPMQQWYEDASFSDFSFDYGGMAGASSSHPPPFDSHPPAHTHDDDGEDGSEQDKDDE
jgi:hypothetical protein